MNTEHQLKSKLAWSVLKKSMKLKQKWCRSSNNRSAKNDVFIFLLGWTDFWWGGNKNLVGRGEWANFWLVVVTFFIPPVGKALYIYIYIYTYIYIYICFTYYTYTYIKRFSQQVFTYNEEPPFTSHTSCTKVAILLLQDLSNLWVTDIYGIYFHLSAQFL